MKSRESLYVEQADLVLIKVPNTIGVYKIHKNRGYITTKLESYIHMVDADFLKQHLDRKDIKVCWLGVHNNFMEANFEAVGDSDEEHTKEG